MSRDSVSKAYRAQIIDRRWLSPTTFELGLRRPSAFIFQAGQFIRFRRDDITEIMERDYSLIVAPSDPDIRLLVRDTAAGGYSTFLGKTEIGTALEFMGPLGYFTYQSDARPAVFVATGTGIAPFVSMARSGISGFVLLHGVQTAVDLYYEAFFRRLALRYVPCLSITTDASSPRDAFHGRVTVFLADRLPPGRYDFYLSGRREMIRDATLIIDDRFSGSRVYSEIFY